MLDHELEVSVRGRRTAFVVDPLLALATPFGAELVQRLGPHVDLWMVRSFWQVLDASEYYRRDPLALFAPAAREAAGAAAAAGVRLALDFWEGVRARTDLTSFRLHWVSDNVAESALADGTPPDLVERYERLHQTLAARVDPGDEATESAAYFGALDTLALAAALGPVRVLTLAPSDPRAALAACCASTRLPLTPTAAAAAGLERERAGLGDLLAQAGATPLVWCGLALSVVHVVMPCSVAGAPCAELVLADDGDEPLIDAVGTNISNVTSDPWEVARAFWYVP